MIGLVVEILGDATGLSKAVDSTGGIGKKLEGSFGGAAIKVAAVAGVAGIAAGAIFSMADAAAQDRDEVAKLDTAIRAAGAATGDYATKVDEAIAAGADRAFSDSEVRDGLQSLVTATGDVSVATDELKVAQDLARFAGVDLATAADAVAKAHGGQDGALRKLVPGLEKGQTAMDTLAAASEAAAGQADAYATSAEGMQKKAGNSFDELVETIGSAFLPILDALLPALTPILDALSELVVALLPLLTPAIKALGIALKIVADVLTTVVGWLIKLVDWVGKAIDKVGSFLDKLNPLKDFKMPSLPFLSGAPAGGSGPTATTRSGTSSAAAFAPTVNVYTTGDGIEAEQAVVRALRRVTRLNGGVVPALGWAGAIR